MKYNTSIGQLNLSKKLIPGGNTLAKASYFSSGKTPFSLVKGKGATVTDVDGNTYIDFIMGLGAVCLGYCNKRVDDAIKKQINSGITFSLANPLETEVAQKLIQLIPSAEMVRFGKNGSDVLTAAVKLARFVTKKDIVLSCGYHGWHDWCVIHTSKSGGIPNLNHELSKRFRYNDIESLKNIIKSNKDNVACIVMEVVSKDLPNDNYLHDVHNIAKDNNILLVFDEIITGFRINTGGAQKHYAVTPDLSCFGKALGNGMPISALVGKRNIMERLNDIFFTLTFAGEALSLAAAKEALNIYDEKDIYKDLSAKGQFLKEGFNSVIKKNKLNGMLEIAGMDCRPIISFRSKYVKDYRIINSIDNHIIQRFCENNILTNLSFFLSYSHVIADLEHCINSFDKVCNFIKTLK
jgi:glutamate-1-semialdehyde aminotransferase